MNGVLRFSVFIFLVFVGLCSFTLLKEKSKQANNYQGGIEFKYANFPKGKYHLQIDTVRLPSYYIEIIQVSEKNNEHIDMPSKSWIRLRKGPNTFSQFYFESLDASLHHGFSGITFSEKSLRNDCFIASIYGLPETQVIILDKTGTASFIQGENIFISNDKNILFANNSKNQALSVFDLNTHKILFEGKTDFALDKWYFHNGHYYATIQDDPRSNNKINIVYFDFSSKKPISKKEMNGFVRFDKSLREMNEVKLIKQTSSVPDNASSFLNF